MQVTEVDARDVFVLVLVPSNMLEADICGRKITEWVDITAKGFQNRKINLQRNDNIVTIIKNSVIDTKYCVVLYADTPLLTRATVEQALSFAATYGHRAVQLPRGWVFETDYIKTVAQIEAVAAPNLPEDDFLIAYNYAQVAVISTFARVRINDVHLANGVQITDPHNVYIDADVQIGKGTKIGPGVILRGETKIGENCRITNFVEIKKSTVGDGTKISHMSYIGDATIGKECNIGCGVVCCNYDGKEKHKTTIGNKAFIGSNTNLVAPVTVGNGAFVAAGSTITNDVPDKSFGIARARQAIKEGWLPGQNDGAKE